MKRLFYCRHGESELNLAEAYAGHLDTPLTKRGREQAESAGNTARKLGIDLIVSSPLVRASETAAIIADVIGYPRDKIITDKQFLERDHGELAGKPWDTPDPESYAGLESTDELRRRTQQALDYLRSLEAENILVVGHGSFYVALAGLLKPGEEIPEPPNATVVQLI